MPQIVDIPGKGTAEFPDDWTQAQIQDSIWKSFPEFKPKTPETTPPPTKPFPLLPFVGTGEFGGGDIPKELGGFQPPQLPRMGFTPKADDQEPVGKIFGIPETITAAMTKGSARKAGAIMVNAASSAAEGALNPVSQAMVLAAVVQPEVVIPLLTASMGKSGSTKLAEGLVDLQQGRDDEGVKKIGEASTELLFAAAPVAGAKQLAGKQALTEVPKFEAETLAPKTTAAVEGMQVEPVVLTPPTVEPPASPPDPLLKLGEAIKNTAIGRPSTSPKSKLVEAIKPILDQAKTGTEKALALSQAGYEWMKQNVISLPKFTDWQTAIGKLHYELSKSRDYAKQVGKIAEKQLQDPARIKAMTAWIDCKGDPAVLAQAASEVPEGFRQKYTDAQTLTAQELELATKVRDYFETRLDDAIANGLFEQGVEDYLHRVYDKKAGDKVEGAISAIRGLLQTNPSLAKRRFFQFDFEAEKAGLTPNENFVQRILHYDQAFNRAIAARAFVKNVIGTKEQPGIVETDGRPRFDVSGTGIPVQTEGVPEATLIIPRWKPNDATLLNDRSDYVAFDHPAFRHWKWGGTDENGNPILFQGDVVVHPKAIPEVRALLEKSFFQRGESTLARIGSAYLKAQTMIKQTALAALTPPGFHAVQETVHAAEHRVAPWNVLDKINYEEPTQRALIEHGVTTGGTDYYQAWSEGLSGVGLFKFVPKAGTWLHAYNEWLFTDWIPRLKMTMALDALERNRSRYAKDLETGKITDSEVMALTAREANAAFGEQNYAMMGRHPTTQDVLRMVFLAPDFGEARMRFAAQAATRYGGEQRMALLLGAATLYVTARTLNNIIGEGDDPVHHPFEVKHNKKWYSLRTVQEDLWRASDDTGRFLFNRMSPGAQTVIEYLTERDYRGRQRTGVEEWEDALRRATPITFRTEKDRALWEQYLQANGITIREDKRK